MAACVIKDLFQDLTAKAKLPSDAIEGSNAVVKSQWLKMCAALAWNPEILKLAECYNWRNSVLILHITDQQKNWSYGWPPTSANRQVEEERLRPVTQLDLLFGLDKMKESKKASAFMLPGVPEVALDWPPACNVPLQLSGTHLLPTYPESAMPPVDEDSRARLHHKLRSQCTVLYHLRSWSEGLSSASKIYFSTLSHFLRYLFSTLPFF